MTGGLVGTETGRGEGGGKHKIAFIKRGLFSYSNVRTQEQLERTFPDFDIEVIDVVADLLRKHRAIVAANLCRVVLRYRRELATRRQTLRLAFFRTPYIFLKIREMVRTRLWSRRSEFAFTFQTQSMYDASVPGIPHFVYTDHTHLVNLRYPAFSPDALFAREWVDLEREIYLNADRVFVMSEHVRKSLIEQYAIAPGKTLTVFAGSNVDPTPVPLENHDYGNRTILFVGVDWERKGGPCLLDAFDQVHRAMPDARLVIVGCEPPVKNPQIKVLGKVSREEVKRQLVQATLLCLPSRVEPFGIAPLEAFFHRLPVVATRIGALPGFIRHGENGLLVEPDDSKALANALLDLLQNAKKCRQFGEFGHALVSQNFTWAKTGERLRDGIAAALKDQHLAR